MKADQPILQVPVIKVVLTLASGEVIERIWTMTDMETGESGPDLERLGAINWLEGRRRVWDHPQDPVTFMASVPEGREDEARGLLA